MKPIDYHRLERLRLSRKPERIHKRVTFQDEVYWLNGEPNGLQLSPLWHFNEEGNLLINPFDDVAFAIIEDGKVKRYGVSIGDISEIQDVLDEQAQAKERQR